MSIKSLAVIGALLVWTRYAPGQEYRPYFIDQGAASFLRAVDDSTIVALDARYAPAGTRLDLDVFFHLYRVHCAPPNGRSYSYLDSRPTEGAALHADPAVAHKPEYVKFGLPETATEALVHVGCDALADFERRDKRPSTPKQKPAQPLADTLRESFYELFWNADGVTGYLRVLNDSTVMIASVRYSPYRGETGLHVEFEQRSARCQGYPNSWATALLSIGRSETEALVVLGPPHYIVSKTTDVASPSPLACRLSAECAGTMVLSSCSALRRWKDQR